MRLPVLFILLACTTASIAAQPSSMRSEGFARYAFKPLVRDYYPATSRALSEQGATKIKLCYDVHGMPRHVTVHEGSGFPNLDAAAVRWGKAVRITPGLSNGEPIPSCALVPVRFAPDGSGVAQVQEEDFLFPFPDVPPLLPTIPLPPPPGPGRFIPLGNEI